MHVLSIAELIDELHRQANIIKHLVGKIPPHSLDYKPTEKQRSMVELLQYISYMAPAMANTIATGSADSFGQDAAQAGSVTLDTFAERFDAGITAASATIRTLTEPQLAELINPFGIGPAPRNRMLVDLLGMMAAYKMQLFLYIKAAGNQSIGTSNLWAGIDMPS